MPRLINTTSVETRYGFRAFSLFEGDITEGEDGLLVVSSHLGSGHPGGRVLNALRRNWKLALADFTPLLHFGSFLGTFLPTEPTPRPVVLVRMPGIRWLREQGFPVEVVYEEAVRAVFGSVGAIELRGEQHRLVALPLLGGSRGYDRRRAMATILKCASQWLQLSRWTERVDFFLVEQDLVAQWSVAMNDVLGRTFVDAARRDVAEALASEVLEIVSTSPALGHPALTGALEPRRQSLEAKPVCLQQVAAFARVLIERIVQAVATGSGIAWKGSLLEDIETVRREGIVAPWMISHFHSLRILGNETV